MLACHAVSNEKGSIEYSQGNLFLIIFTFFFSASFLVFSPPSTPDEPSVP
jgi:hypothetical protein